MRAIRMSSMMTWSNGFFSALLAICVGNSPVTGEFPAPVTQSFDDFFDLRLYKRLSVLVFWYTMATIMT